MKTVKYGLKHKSGRLLSFYTESNHGEDCCGDLTYRLRLGDGTSHQWTVDDPLNAEYVRQHSTEWYNAGYGTPNHRFNPDDLEVVRITTETEEEVIDVKIPSQEEYLSLRYNTPGNKYYSPAHYKYCMKHVDHGIGYGLFDLRELVMEGIINGQDSSKQNEQESP